MQNSFFLREAITNAKENVSFIVLNQKQMHDSLIETIKQFSAKNKVIIVVSFATPINEIASVFGGKNIYFIDCTSNDENPLENTILQTVASDLTGILMAIDSISRKIPGEKIIIFDALNMMGLYNEIQPLGKFMHLFSNKTKMSENTAVFFTVKQSTDEKTMNLARQFADNYYDYSDFYLAAVSSMETK